eukprot:GEMP01057669.1.p1 GENE.GEMP01057669.1~~GEMP01057669.1.p1  ORF type:complete len:212 (+),score=35.31 GEMP01057669.1:67-702(+)
MSCKPKAYAFTPKAYAKAVYHCCKHSQSLVVGVLVGSRVDKVQQITDCMPLFHVHALEPFVGISMAQIEAYCNQNELEICGLYYANASGSLADLPINVKNIAEKIGSNVPQSTLWVLDMLRLNDSETHVLQGTFASKEEIKSSSIAPDIVYVSLKAHNMAIQGVANMEHMKLVDFEDHLNLSVDWRNINLCKGILWSEVPNGETESEPAGN